MSEGAVSANLVLASVSTICDASGEDDLLPKANASASCSQYSVQRQLVPVH